MVAKSKYKLGDIFTQRFTRDTPEYEITDIVYEQYGDITYVMEQCWPVRGDSVKRISESAIDEIYYKIN